MDDPNESPQLSQIVSIPVAMITVGDRIRTDMGDIEPLAQDIARHGLIHPIVVSVEQDGTIRLVSGHRRLLACQLSGMDEVPCRVVKGDATFVSEIEIAENAKRKPFGILEIGEVALKEVESGRSVPDVARMLGVSGYHVRKCLAVARYVKANPDKRPDIEAALDTPGGRGLVSAVASACDSQAQADTVASIEAGATLVCFPESYSDVTKAASLSFGCDCFCVAHRTSRDALTWHRRAEMDLGAHGFYLAKIVGGKSIATIWDRATHQHPAESSRQGGLKQWTASVLTILKTMPNEVGNPPAVIAVPPIDGPFLEASRAVGVPTLNWAEVAE